MKKKILSAIAVLALSSVVAHATLIGSLNIHTAQDTNDVYRLSGLDTRIVGVGGGDSTLGRLGRQVLRIGIDQGHDAALGAASLQGFGRPDVALAGPAGADDDQVHEESSFPSSAPGIVVH